MYWLAPAPPILIVVVVTLGYMDTTLPYTNIARTILKNIWCLFVVLCSVLFGWGLCRIRKFFAEIGLRHQLNIRKMTLHWVMNDILIFMVVFRNSIEIISLRTKDDPGKREQLLKYFLYFDLAAMIADTISAACLFLILEQFYAVGRVGNLTYQQPIDTEIDAVETDDEEVSVPRRTDALL